MIEKLIKEYEQKIQERQAVIEQLSEVVREHRKEGTCGFYDSIDEVLALRKGERALQQAYAQFIVDLRDIIDIN